MLLQKLKKKQLIHPPEWLVTNTHYLVYTGSVAYGVSNDTSDLDMYGFCVPTKEIVFPHLAGEITGFGRKKERFEQWQEHHIVDKDARKEYDFQVFSIVKFFHLCMENNPNMIDTLFVPDNCIMHITALGSMVREKRKMFLHKGAWHRFKGYSYSQMHKMRIKEPEGKRKEMIEKYGYDVKFAYHVVRLLAEVEQILTEGDLDLQKNREQLKSIRRGEWTMHEIEEHFKSKEQQLEEVYNKSELPHSPDEHKIRNLLLDCLEHHFGSLDKLVTRLDKNSSALRQIKDICLRALHE